MTYTIKEIRVRNLRLLIAESGLSQGAFALKVDTAPAYISQIFSKTTKRSLGDLMARKIETKLNLPKAWMDTLHTAEEYQALRKGIKTPVAHNLLGVLDLYDEELDEHSDDVLLDFLTPQHLSAGAQRTEMTEPVEHKLRFSKALLNKLGIAESAAYGWVVEGNSMAPVLPEGALLGIDTQQTEIKDGDIYAIDHFGNLRIKMLYNLPGGSIRLRSYNQVEWPDEHVSYEELSCIKVLGRVFWWSVVR
jgi:phage repressor protein C with HTH and peptisase S24 domain